MQIIRDLITLTTLFNRNFRRMVRVQRRTSTAHLTQTVYQYK